MAVFVGMGGEIILVAYPFTIYDVLVFVVSFLQRRIGVRKSGSLQCLECLPTASVLAATDLSFKRPH